MKSGQVGTLWVAPKTPFITTPGDIELYAEELETYRVDSLTEEQKNVYDHIMSNLGDICVIQAGPGSGKTFVLKTCAYNKVDDLEFKVVIFKHDLLHAFRYCGNTSTVASHIMKMLEINFMAFKSLDVYINSNISPVDFGLTMCELMSVSKIDPTYTIILDEYTVISKPFLVLLMIMSYHHKIGMVLCGDRDQLQCIRDTNMMKETSSYELAKQMSTHTFKLTKNIRCGDVSHTELISTLQRYSSNRRLDNFAQVMLAAQFLNKLFTTPEYNSIHMAGIHRELAQTIHSFVCRDGIPTEMYTTMAVDKEDKKMYLPTTSLKYAEAYERNPKLAAIDDKYVPYLPLSVGSRYYVKKQAESEVGVLRGIFQDRIIVQMEKSGENVTLQRGRNTAIPDAHLKHCNDMMEKHLRHGLISYPIYPYNFISIHKSQGMTILGNLDINLTSTNYQGMYVAISRVKNPSQIRRVTVANQLSAAITAILNIPDLDDYYNKYVPMEIIEQRLENYTYYNIQSHLGNILYDKVVGYINSPDPVERKRIRLEIGELSKSCCIMTPKCTDQEINNNTYSSYLNDDYGEGGSNMNCENSKMLEHMVSNRELFLSLAYIPKIDRIIWLYTFSKIDFTFMAINNKWRDGTNVAPSAIVDEATPKGVGIREFILNNCHQCKAKDLPLDPKSVLLYTEFGISFYTTPFRKQMWKMWDEDSFHSLTKEDMLQLLYKLVNEEKMKRPIRKQNDDPIAKPSTSKGKPKQRKPLKRKTEEPTKSTIVNFGRKKLK